MLLGIRGLQAVQPAYDGIEPHDLARYLLDRPINLSIANLGLPFDEPSKAAG